MLCNVLSCSVYFVRELVCRSLQGRRVDMVTVTSVSGAMPEREATLKGLFPSEKDQAKPKSRPFQFTGKKVVFLSSRVHPGETQSRYETNPLNFLADDWT